MSQYKGKFIVIDGTDGSGKTTQLNLLRQKLESQGYKVEVADFPQYNTKSAGAIEEYLSGKYGSAEEVGPYKASIFYAIDRYDASFKIRQWLQEGKIVLSNRYTSANMGHQGSKIDNHLERKVFFNWLYELEYKLFNIPQPDLSIILHVKPEISQQLAKDRKREDWKGKTKDIHEDNINHLKKAEQVYLEIAQDFPNFKLIECSHENGIMSREEIHQKVWSSIQKLITKNDSNDFQAIADIIQKKYTPLEKKINNDIINKDLIVSVEKINSQAMIPKKAHSEDAGYDLYASEPYSIPPYSRALISTGIKMSIPKNHVGLIWDKSGLALKDGITTLGGVIDSNYRGEIKIIVQNLSEEVFNIIPGQKIAQILIQPLIQTKIQEEKINDNTERQNNGFGSSGKF